MKKSKLINQLISQPNTPTQNQFTNCELEQIDKQAIDEMARVIEQKCNRDCIPSCDECIAQTLYNAGYRKQSEGVWTFNKDGSGTCSNCHFTQKGVWDYDNHQHFCGVCGAKMKGGE